MVDKEKKLSEEIRLLQNKVKELEKLAFNHINVEAELKRATEEWELTFNAVTELIFILDKEQKIVRANKAFANFINLKPEDIIGKYCYELVHQTNKPIPGCPVEKTMKDGRAHTEEVDEPRLGASFLVGASPILDDKGRFIGAVHIAKDISVLKKSTEATARLAAIVESSEDAIISKSLEGTILSWNKGAEKIYGYSSEEVKGKHVSILAPQEYKDEISQIIAKIKRGESVNHFETLRIRKDGRQINVSLSVSPIKDSSGNLIGASTIARDITERKKAAEALRESEFRFRQLAESLPQLVWTCRPDGACDYLSSQWVEFTGVPEAKQLGFGWLDQVHPDDRSALMAAWNTSVASGEPFKVEFRIRHHSGDYHWFDTRASALRDATGRIVKWSGLNMDITESKILDEALKESENNYRTVFENVPVGIYRNTVELDSRFLGANPAMVKMFGYDSLNEFLKIRTKDLYINPEQRKLFICEITAKGIVRDRELHLKKKDGTPIWCAITAKIQYDENGKIKWIDGVIEDITERKLLEEELNKRIETLERFQRVTVDRELKMKELKSRIVELETKLQQNSKKE